MILLLSTGSCGLQAPSQDEKYVDAMPRRPRSIRPADESELNVNQIVAFNLRAARQLEGWTQEALAREITRRSGTHCTRTMVSELERAWDGRRRREFDAHEIAVFAAALKVPIGYFFLPPPDENRRLEGIGRSVSELHLLFFGYFDTAEKLDARMREYGGNFPPEYEGPIAELPSRVGPWSYKKRRKKLLIALLEGMADEVDQAFETIGKLADLARRAGIRGYIAEQANDPDYAVPPENRPSVSGETDETSGSPPSEPPDHSSPDSASPSPEPAAATRDSQ